MIGFVLVCTADQASSSRLQEKLGDWGLGLHLAAPVSSDEGWEALPGTVDLLIAHLDYPACRCRQHVTHLRRLSPSLGVVFLSRDSAAAARLRLWRPSGYVHKPSAADDLLRVAHELLPAAA